MSDTPSTDEHALRIEALYQDRLVPCYAHRPDHLDAMFRASVQRRPQALAIEEGERSLTYAQLDLEVGRLSAGWAARGIGSGDRVALFLGNRIEFVLVLLSLWRLGAIAVPIGIRQSAAELEYMLGQCGACALVFEGTLADRLPRPDAIPGVGLLVHCLDADENGEVLQASGLPSVLLADLSCDPPLRASPDGLSDQAPACIMYTSGTTGHPKGAVLSHLLLRNAANVARCMHVEPDDVVLGHMPFYHVAGCIATLAMCLLVGCTPGPVGRGSGFAAGWRLPGLPAAVSCAGRAADHAGTPHHRHRDGACDVQPVPAAARDRHLRSVGLAHRAFWRCSHARGHH